MRPARVVRKKAIWLSLNSRSTWPRRIAARKIPKGRLPTIMKRETTRSIGASLVAMKAPSEASLVEKPPVATVVMAWFSASKADMPNAQSSRKQSAVKKA